MVPQIFAMTCAFHWRRRGNRVLPCQAPTPSSAAEAEYPPVTGRRSQPSAELSALDLQSRADKIAQLRRAVEHGAYCVSAEQLAEKIVQELLADMFT
jgi:Anti-sigma-28 factor, FlgM